MGLKQKTILSAVLVLLALAIFWILKTSSVVQVTLPDDYRIDQTCKSTIRTIHEKHHKSNEKEYEDYLDDYDCSFLLTANGVPVQWHQSMSEISIRDYYSGEPIGYVQINNAIYYHEKITEQDSVLSRAYHYLLPLDKVLNVPQGTLKQDMGKHIVVKNNYYYTLTTQSYILAFYVLVHFLFLVLAYYIAILLDQKYTSGVGTLVLATSALLCRYIMSTDALSIRYVLQASDHILWIENLLNITFLFVFSLFLFVHRNFTTSPKRSMATRFVLRYFTSFAIAIYFQLVIKFLMILHTSLAMNLEPTHYNPAKMLGFLLSYGALSFSSFLFCYKYFKLLSYDAGPRWLGAAHILAFASSAVLFRYVAPGVPLWGYLIGILIIFALMDVFTERIQKNMSWFIIWSTVFAILGSSIFVQGYKSSTHRDTAEALTSYLHTLDTKWSPEEIWNPKFSYSQKHELLLSNTDNYAINKWGDILSLNENGSFYISSRNAALSVAIPEIKNLSISKKNSSTEDEISIASYQNGSHYTIHSKGWTAQYFYETNWRTIWLDLFSVMLLFYSTCIVLLLISDAIFHFLPRDFLRLRWREMSYKNKIHLAIQTIVLLSFALLIGINILILHQNNDSSHNRGFEANIEFVRSEPFKYQTKSYESLSSLALYPHFLLDLALYKNDKFSNAYFSDFLFPPSTLAPIASVRTNTGVSQIALLEHSNTKKNLLARFNNSSTKEAYNDLMRSIYMMFKWFSFILLIVIGLAQLFAENITRPLLRLRQDIAETGVDKRLSNVAWSHKDDEIGALINAYNNLIKQKENYANKMMQTEREGAWQEMAQQVAHEISNPLTPMKLSLQYLQNRIPKAIDLAEAEEITSKVSNTLIEQIENLSNIATSFSIFSRLPQPRFEKANLSELLENAHRLYENSPRIDVNIYLPIDDVYVMVDKNQMIQVLNNLLKNAIQSIPEATHNGQIAIKLETKKDQAIVTISDTGSGIPPETRSKVFQPNFTTKNSGTGLGLAISYKIIQMHKGDIYFKTSMNNGTSFFIELPLVS